MSEGSIHLCFDATSHPVAAERIVAWRDAMSLSVDVAFRQEEIDSFEGRLDFYPLGTVLLVDAYLTPHTMIRSKKTITRSGDAHVILDFFPSGGFQGTVGAQSLEIDSGDCFLMDLKGTLHVHLKTSRFIGVIIPRNLLIQNNNDIRIIHGKRFLSDSAEAQILGATLISYISQASRLTTDRANLLGISLVGLIAACLDRHKSSQSSNGSFGAEPDLARIRRYIERHASDPDLDPRSLSAVFGLSRATLYRNFKSEGGIAEIIRQRRASIALHLLSDKKNSYISIESIARASGFSDPRSLRRALRDFYNALPSDLRLAKLKSENSVHGLEIGALFDTQDRSNKE